MVKYVPNHFPLNGYTLTLRSDFFVYLLDTYIYMNVGR